MHFEILIEDASGKVLLEVLLPKIINNEYSRHTWRIINYKGVGRIPSNLHRSPDATNRFLLDQLPRLLRGYGKTYPEGAHDTAVIVVLDCDRKDCRILLSEMMAILNKCAPKPNILFRIAIEECEAWILGDRNAVKTAYPKANNQALNGYVQDSICGTWEILADAIFLGGSAILSKKPFFEIGKIKCEWAKQIGPFIDVEENLSTSFCKFRDGVRRLITEQNRQS
ncbi:MAG: hypothetical protein JW863_22550 [Chitinispirillaceae bacterium]|nr:hypothetical protein [Chitinispirillaceae bacterium]